MRHVISYTFSITLFCGLSHLVSTLPQESLLWSDPQLSSEEWHPFVPPNYPGLGERTLQTYPRTETIRQYFGKTPVEPALQHSPPAQNPVLKKSFQAQSIAANNLVDQYAIAPVIGSFNSFGVQTVQTRNPVFEKNIKDGHLLEQPTQFQFKYQPFPQQQVSTSVHRFPAYFSPSSFEHFQRQPSVNVQQASFHGHAAPALAGNRYESALKQLPSRTPVATTIQVFPPPPPHQSASVPHSQQFGHQNTYYLNVPPPPKEEYSDSESLLDRKQARPAEYHQSFNLYNTRDGNGAQKTVVQQQQSNQNAFFENVKTPATEKYEYEIVGNVRPASYSTIFGNEHTRGGAALLRPNIEVKKPTADEPNPGKQVYEQLSPLGRPFTLSKDGGAETESESLSSYGSVPRPPSKKTKNKASQSHSNPVSITYHRVPSGVNGIESLVDYESGKLQSVKSVNYFPQRETNRFNEEDLLGNNVLLYHPTSEKQPTQNSFLPTPTDTNENDADTHLADPASSLTYNYHHNRFTTTSTTAAPIFDGSSQLPHNHKYSPANLRHRQPAASVWRQQTPSSEGSKYSFPQPEEYEQDNKMSYDTVEYEPTTTMPSSTTKRTTHIRRRKPSKLKNKNRTNVLAEEGETSTSTTEENYPRLGSNTYEQSNTKVRYSYYDAEENRNSYPNTNEAINTAYSSEETPTTTIQSPTTQSYPVKKKHFKIRTTTVATDEEYPNYPLEYFNQQQQQQQQQHHHHHQYQQQEQTNEPYITESTDSVKQEEQREISKTNYPTAVSKPKTKPNFAASLRPTVASTTEGTTTTAPSPVPKVRTRTRPPGTVTNSPASSGVNLTRPRFSIKDYKRTTTVSPSSTAPPSASGNDGDSAVNENNVEIEKKGSRKNLYALRNKNRGTTDSDASNDGVKAVTENNPGEEEPAIRKYKPRVRPANKYSYKISTPSTTTVSSSSAVTEATSERVNTFRPSSGGRIRSSTSKYYNRYRTTTEGSKNLFSNDNDNDRHPSASGSTHEDYVQASSSNIKPTRTLLFSAKKSTITAIGTSTTAPGTVSPNLNKVVEYEDDEDDLVDDEYEDEGEEDRILPPAKKPSSHIEISAAKTKKHNFHKKPAISPTNLDKADDMTGMSIMTSSEEETEKKQRHHQSGNRNSNSTSQQQQFYHPQSDKLDDELDLSMVTMDGKDEEMDKESESVIYKKIADNEQLIASTVSSTSTSSDTNTESATMLMTTATTLLPEEQHESEDDVNERVSKISMLTSQDELNHVNGVAVNSSSGSSYKHHWRFPFFSIAKISESDY